MAATYVSNPHSAYRVKFDFKVEFANGGYVEGKDFLLDLDRDDVDTATLAELIVDAMNLARSGPVSIGRKEIVRRGQHDDGPQSEN
jgi:hypothetical protein